MAVLTKEQMLERLKEKIGESVEDADITLLEDINDTLDDYERKTAGTEDWERKYQENDRAWREKYRDRFFKGEEPEVEVEIEVKEKNLTYESLFE